MKPLSFTHTTYNTEVFVYPDQVIAVFHLPTMNSTVVIGPGSTAIPVQGTVEEVIKKISGAKGTK